MANTLSVPDSFLNQRHQSCESFSEQYIVVKKQMNPTIRHHSSLPHPKSFPQKQVKDLIRL